MSHVRPDVEVVELSHVLEDVVGVERAALEDAYGVRRRNLLELQVRQDALQGVAHGGDVGDVGAPANALVEHRLHHHEVAGGDSVERTPREGLRVNIHKKTCRCKSAKTHMARADNASNEVIYESKTRKKNFESAKVQRLYRKRPNPVTS